MGLRLAPNLDLPLSFATEGVAAVGMRGSGKSTTLRRWAEVLNKAGIPFVVIDPKGDWWGLRSSADGKHDGLSIAVFGGLYATDGLPLEEHLGKRIADLLVEENLSAVLDVSRLSIAARGRFLTDFCNQLMERHQVEPHVRCVILEEAHRYIPQQVKGPQAALKEAAASILLEGRAFGLGCWAATQRPARLHKDVLEEVGTAVLHRIGAAATNDLRTIGGWVKHEELGDEIVPSLTKLKDGEAWILAPSTLGIAKRVQIDRSHTFDSGATPIVGTGSRPTVTMAQVDTAAIKEALSDAIEKAKADDPKLLRARITELERHLRDTQKAAPAPEQIEVRVEVPVLSQEAVEALRGASGALSLTRDVLDAAMKQFATPGVPRASGPTRERKVAVVRELPPPTEQRVQHSRPAALDASRSDSSLGKAERAFLTVLAQYPDGRTRDQVAIFAGYSVKSRHIDNTLAALRSAAYIEGGRDHIRITTTGLGALGDWEQLPTGSALISHFKIRFLGKAASEFLDVVLDAHPSVVTRDEIAERAGYSVQSRHVDNTLAQLRSLQLISGGRDGIRLNHEFAEAIA